MAHRVHSLLSVCSSAVSEPESGTLSATGLWWSPWGRGGKPKGRMTKVESVVMRTVTVVVVVVQGHGGSRDQD